VWQYSRRVDGNVQVFSLGIRSKQRKQGGRRARVGTEDASQAATSSLDSLTLSDSGKTDSAEQKLGRYKYLCAVGDIEGTMETPVVNTHSPIHNLSHTCM
jgi:hypothetical protein